MTRRREGRYLLRSNLCEQPHARLWELYIQLTPIEEAFKNLEGDRAICPIYRCARTGSKRTSFSASSPAACTSR